MTYHPLVSVVIPIFNVERYLNQCVQSIVNQSYNELDIVLVDDGSSDHSSSICDHWASVDARIRVIHKRNGGLSDARNVGIQHCHGDYILCLDADDLVVSTLVQQVVERFSDKTTDLVFFKYSLIDENGNAVQGSFSEEFPYPEGKFVSKQVLQYMLNGFVPNYAWSFIVKRDLYLKPVLYPKDRKMEDLATTYKLVHYSRFIQLINEPLYLYRLREGSILHQKSAQLVSDYVTDIEEFCNFIQKNYPSLSGLQINWAVKNLFTASLWLFSIDQLQHNEKVVILQRINRLLRIYASQGFSKLTLQNHIKYSISRLHLTKLASTIAGLQRK